MDWVSFTFFCTPSTILFRHSIASLSVLTSFLSRLSSILLASYTRASSRLASITFASLFQFPSYFFAPLLPPLRPAFSAHLILAFRFNTPRLREHFCFLLPFPPLLPTAVSSNYISDLLFSTFLISSPYSNCRLSLCTTYRQWLSLGFLDVNGFFPLIYSSPPYLKPSLLDIP